MLSHKNSPYISLEQMLEAREKRAFFQERLLKQFQLPLLCFTMNIAGPFKTSPLIRRAFQIGLQDILLQLQRANIPVAFQTIWQEDTGNTAFILAKTRGDTLKKLACELEDADLLGRLYDMDILLPPDGGKTEIPKIDRQTLGLPPRTCLLCHRPAKECSSRRIHTLEALQETTKKILEKSVIQRDAQSIARLAQQALLYEAAIAPKPGLVDRIDNGSHQDMDLFTFLSSAASLFPYFQKCAALGLSFSLQEAPQDKAELFSLLRLPGKLAENQMLLATGGVNTHKGAVFSMGILCAAIGAQSFENRKDPQKILQTCGEMTRGMVSRDLKGLTLKEANTTGQKLYVQYGISGIRGEIEAGLPAVYHYGLPLMEKMQKEGRSIDETGTAVLLHLFAHVTDTNFIARSDVKTWKKTAESLAALLKDNPIPSRRDLEELNRTFIQKNVSPGGSADLLSVCWMLYFMKTFF